MYDDEDGAGDGTYTPRVYERSTVAELDELMLSLYRLGAPFVKGTLKAVKKGGKTMRQKLQEMRTGRLSEDSGN